VRTGSSWDFSLVSSRPCYSVSWKDAQKAALSAAMLVSLSVGPKGPAKDAQKGDSMELVRVSTTDERRVEQRVDGMASLTDCRSVAWTGEKLGQQ
jgi:hypothetical protein